MHVDPSGPTYHVNLGGVAKEATHEPTGQGYVVCVHVQYTHTHVFTFYLNIKHGLNFCSFLFLICKERCKFVYLNDEIATNENLELFGMFYRLFECNKQQLSWGDVTIGQTRYTMCYVLQLYYNVMVWVRNQELVIRSSVMREAVLNISVDNPSIFKVGYMYMSIVSSIHVKLKFPPMWQRLLVRSLYNGSLRHFHV